MRKSIGICAAVLAVLWSLGFVRRVPDFLTFEIVALDTNETPVPSATVFVDIGGPALERIVADSTGTAKLFITRQDFRHAIWLICAPGFVPGVGKSIIDDSPGAIHHLVRESINSQPSVRSSGWHGPMPRECPQFVDSVGWFTSPAKKDSSWRELVRQEPDWARVTK